MRLDFEAGVILGQTLEQIKEHSGRLDDHETRIDNLEVKARLAESWVGRIIAAGSLWAAGTGLNLSAENLGALLARLLRFGGPTG